MIQSKNSISIAAGSAYPTAYQTVQFLANLTSGQNWRGALVDKIIYFSDRYGSINGVVQ